MAAEEASNDSVAITSAVIEGIFQIIIDGEHGREIIELNYNEATHLFDNLGDYLTKE